MRAVPSGAERATPATCQAPRPAERYAAWADPPPHPPSLRALRAFNSRETNRNQAKGAAAAGIRIVSPISDHRQRRDLNQLIRPLVDESWEWTSAGPSSSGSILL